MMTRGNEFFDNVAKIIEQARAYVGRTADLTMCVAYFEIGRMIVEEEQGGKARAEYGHGLLKELSAYLNKRVGKGFSESTLRNARKFYQVYAPAIQQTLFAESEKNQTTFVQSYVLIDLKTGILKHQDLGQMQMYVHYFDRYVKTNDEHPTVGILLCKEKDNAIVELTLSKGENIYASEYSLYLPDKTLLQQKLSEWTREFEEAREAIEMAETFGGETDEV
jgi:hypothetical protein